jgi:hypothetical protein
LQATHRPLLGARDLLALPPIEQLLSAGYDLLRLGTSTLVVSCAESKSVIYAIGGNDVAGGSNGLATNEAFTTPAPVCNYQIVSADTAGNFGFTSPVLNPGSGALPNINSANVNQVIPLQVTVKDCHGNLATSLTLAPPETVVLSAANTNVCTIDNPDNSISTGSAGNSGWQNLGGGSYQFNWKPLPPKGSCLSFSLNLGDGVQHTAYFQFK